MYTGTVCLDIKDGIKSSGRRKQENESVPVEVFQEGFKRAQAIRLILQITQ